MLGMARGDGESKLPRNVLWLPHHEGKMEPDKPKSSYSDQCARQDCLATAYMFWLPSSLPSYVLHGGKVEQTVTMAFLQHPKFPLESYTR